MANVPATVHLPTIESRLKKSLQGLTIAITGTTSGTGLVVALDVVKRGGRVILLNRESERSLNAEKKVKDSVANSDVTSVACDLMDFSSVRKAASEVASLAESGIDCLVFNAGVMAMPDKASADGYDVQMQTNHLSHFLLAQQLFPLLEKAAEARGEARIISMTSEARKNGSPFQAKYLGKNGGNLGGDEEISFTCPQWIRYNQSKMANALFHNALQDKLKAKSSKVKAVLAHPGLSLTGLTTRGGGVPADFEPMMDQLAMSPEDGAAGLLLAIAGQSEEVKSGDFYGPVDNHGMNGPPVNIPVEDICNGEDDKKLLWDESEKAVGAFAL